MRGFGSTEIESGMTCLQLGHVADSPTRSPSVDNRCAAASQSERHRAWRVVPQHAITFVFSNAKSSRQQTHTSSGATVNTLAGDGRVKPPSSASTDAPQPIFFCHLDAILAATRARGRGFFAVRRLSGAISRLLLASAAPAGPRRRCQLVCPEGAAQAGGKNTQTISH